MYHQNIQGMSSKELEIELFLEKYSYDIVCFTEHWFKTHEMLLSYKNHHVASSFNRELVIRGGSLVLIRNGIKAKERKDIVNMSVEQNIELSCVELDKYVIVCVYRPPNSNFSVFLSVMDTALKTISKKAKNVIVCGDFNVNILEKSQETNMFLNLFKSCDLYNVFLEPTRVTSASATCIDNIFCNCNYSDKRIVNYLKSDHSGQCVSIPCTYTVSSVAVRSRPVTLNRIKQFNDVLCNKLPIQDYNFNNSNDFYNKLFTIVQSEFNNIFECKHRNVNVKLKFCDWATPGIRTSRCKLFVLYDMRSYNLSDSFKEYLKKYSNIFKKVCQTAKANFISNRIKSSQNKMKTVWNIINNETGKSKRCNTTFNLITESGIVRSNAEVAQEFEVFFSHIPIKTTQFLNSSVALSFAMLERNIPSCGIDFRFHHVSSREIIKTFKQIKAKYTEDLWGMSVKLCNSVIETLSPYFATLFNRCVDQGIFPDLMKHSKIVPLFKSGDETDPGNFRPVSVLPVFSKIFEKLMLNQMLTHFSVNNLLHTQQFGFTKGRSTSDAGVALIRHIFHAWEKSQDAIGIFCDLSKAFDCVCHDTLLSKLEHYGIRNQGLDILKSYLKNRVQRVQINGTTSTGSLVEMGVPQGSILGPFLFLIYINDLPVVVKDLSNIVLFADDTSLIFEVNRKSNSFEHVNSTLSKVQDWFTVNNLALNPRKTKCINFSLSTIGAQNDKNITLNNETLKFVNNTVFLGITLDSKLQWGPHIAQLSGKLSSAAYAVWKIRQLTDVATARLVYFAYFHSILSYGILLWGRAADIESIFVLQKRAIRAIYRLRRHDSLRQLFKDIKIMTVPSQYIYENIMFARKYNSQFAKNCDRHSHNTRIKNKISQPLFRLAKTQNSFMGMCVRCYNKLPENVLDLSETKFKKYIKKTLCSKAYYKFDDYLMDKSAWNMT